MAGSRFGQQFCISTWGESHGKGIGVVIDGCPAGLSLNETDIQAYLDRRRPGQSRYSTPRKEADQVEILSGVFEGRTTGTPISLLVPNTSQRSKDYGEIASYYRPGHADYTYDVKYGFRDYRGGGRSSGRETIGRVAAGAVAGKLLERLGITLRCYTQSIGDICVEEENFDWSEAQRNPLYMPDAKAARRAEEYLQQCMREQNSAGGVIACVVNQVPQGLGEPCFEKLEANLAKAMLSIGAVRGFEIGDGFKVAKSTGAQNNDAFYMDEEGNVKKATNHAGGTLGGISDGSPLVFRVAVKPTPSISQEQRTVNRDGQDIKVQVKGRHDPIIVPRAVVVVEAMAALVLADALLIGMSSRMEYLEKIWGGRPCTDEGCPKSMDQ